MTKEPFNKFFLKLFIPPALVLLIHYPLWWLYYIITWYDMITHFLGGAAIAWSWLMVQKRYAKDLPNWFNFVTTLGIVALVATLWEFHEYLLDVFIPTQKAQLSLRDTMGDMLMGLLGGIGAYFIKNRKK